MNGGLEAEMAKPKLQLHEGGSADPSGICGEPARTTGEPCRFTPGDKCPWHREDVVIGPRPPSHLDKVGREEWKRRVKVLQEAGLLKFVDLGLLESACEMYQHARRCQDAIARNGEVVQGRDGVKKNPALTYHTKYRREYRICVGQIKQSLKGKQASIDDAADDPLADW